MVYFISNQKRISTNTNEIQEATIQDCLEYFKNKDIIEVDTETERSKWSSNVDRLPDPYTAKVLCIQLGDKNNQFVIDTNVDFSSLKVLMEDKNKLKILANAFFDLRFFYHYGWETVNVYDVFLAECIIYRGKKLPKGFRGLEQMSTRYLGETVSKEVRGQIHWRGLDDTVIRYAAGDVCKLNSIREKQLEVIKERNQEQYLRLENRYVLELAKMSYVGFKLNKDNWLEVEKQNKVKLQELQKQLDDYVVSIGNHKYIDNTLWGLTSAIKWSSSKQVTPFFKDLGIDTSVRDDEDKDSVDIKSLRKQQNKFEILPIYIRYKEVQKEITTYGTKFLQQNLNPVTNRIHPEFFQILETGRISSSNPNSQNIPATDEVGEIHPLRKCFTASEGNMLVISDFSQQEPRITAEYSKDPYLEDFIINGDGDSHSFVATMISEYLLGEHVVINKKNNPLVSNLNRKIRDIAKTINLGRDYGKSAFTTAPDLGISVEECQKMFDIIESKTPKKKEYFTKCANFVKKHGFIYTDKVFLSRTYFENYDRYVELLNIPYEEKTKQEVKEFFKIKGELERFSQNNPIQGTAGLMTKLAHIFFSDEVKKLNLPKRIDVVNVVHDEIVVDCPTEYTEQISKLLSDCMIRAGKIFCERIPMKADPVITFTWEK